MRKFNFVTLGVCCAVMVAAGTANAGSIQFNIGGGAEGESTIVDGGTDLLSSGPAQFAGDLDGTSGGDTTWNNANGDRATGLKYADGTTATGVAIDFGRADAADANEVVWTNTGWSVGGVGGGADGVYLNGIGQTQIYNNNTDLALGVRVTGLAAGQYRVYGISREPKSAGADYDSDAIIGLDISSLPATVGTAELPSGADYSSWSSGDTHYLGTVTTTATTDAITFISRNRDSSYTSIQGLQIVEIPEPSSFALAGLSLVGLIGSTSRRRLSRRSRKG